MLSKRSRPHPASRCRASHALLIRRLPLRYLGVDPQPALQPARVDLERQFFLVARYPLCRPMHFLRRGPLCTRLRPRRRAASPSTILRNSPELRGRQREIRNSHWTRRLDEDLLKCSSHEPRSRTVSRIEQCSTSAYSFDSPGREGTHTHALNRTTSAIGIPSRHTLSDRARTPNGWQAERNCDGRESA